MSKPGPLRQLLCIVPVIPITQSANPGQRHVALRVIVVLPNLTKRYKPVFTGPAVVKVSLRQYGSKADSMIIAEFGAASLLDLLHYRIVNRP